MPMRGELAPPAMRRYSRAGEDQLNWRQIGGEVRDALGRLDRVILLFSGIGLLLTLGLMGLAPHSAHIAAVLAQEF